jgi:hypothetical protein
MRASVRVGFVLQMLGIITATVNNQQLATVLTFLLEV